ncbi:MAG: GPW/gp25 family protein [Magnetococcales bacterium]|nr:GPW/gp25 family protein [Magnetococcales bacterium]
MRGTNPKTGKASEGMENLKSRIRDILTTRIGTRVMRREYGSRLPEMVDQPVNQLWLLEAYSAVAEALDRWEPEIRLIQSKIVSVDSGSITLDIIGEYLPEGREITLDGILV